MDGLSPSIRDGLAQMKDMTHFSTLTALGTGFSAAIGWLAVWLAEVGGIGDSINIITQLGGAGVAGLFGFLVIKYLLKDRDKLLSNIEEMRKERNEMTEKHHQEIMNLNARYQEELITAIKTSKK